MRTSDWIADWLSPEAIDWILFGVGLEFLVLCVLLRARSATRWILPLFFYLLSGATLLLGIRCLLAEAAASVVAGVLASSLVMHLVSLWCLNQQIFGEKRTDCPRNPKL